jgi:hypothetical protein
MVGRSVVDGENGRGWSTGVELPFVHAGGIQLAYLIMRYVDC